MLTSIFENQKICSNPIKSLLIVNINKIFSAKKNEDFAMEQRVAIELHSSFYNVISFNQTPLKPFKTYF